MQQYFGPQGILAQKFDHFEYRSSQLAMAQEVYHCLKREIPLLAEAGTGTGKTWAYLIPAILSGKRVVISTGTKNLQDQILDHDIPLLKKHLFPRLKALCLKGRGNYLCRRRFGDFVYQPSFHNRSEAILFRRLLQWAARTKSGDRAEIPWLPDQFPAWNEVCSSTDRCLASQCENMSRCFIHRMRVEAAQAHIVVVNHHLFFADLALRKKAMTEVLPEYDAVIFDEAHQLEDIVGFYFGVQFSSRGLNELSQDLARQCRKAIPKGQKVQDLLKSSQQLEAQARVLQRVMQDSAGSNGRFPLDLAKVGEGFSRVCSRTVRVLETLGERLLSFREGDPAFDALHRRGSEMARSITRIQTQNESSLIYWFELNPGTVSFHGTPVTVASILEEVLFSRISAVILTSATLTVGGSFQYLRGSLGMPVETRELSVPSPFAYEEQTILYIPPDFPAPTDPAFCRSLAEEALLILRKSRGRGLFLFTSYRNLHQVYDLLKDQLSYPILFQGQKPKRVLLSEFKDRIDSVLMATSSFWQGIDVPGESLTCLLIDKIPFEVPDDPISAARMRYLDSQGKNAFFHYQVPRAVIQLKQGLGRLIRSSQDRGIMGIFDVRLLRKNYGALFLRSLPPCRLVHRLEDLDAYL